MSKRRFAIAVCIVLVCGLMSIIMWMVFLSSRPNSNIVDPAGAQNSIVDFSDTHAVADAWKGAGSARRRLLIDGIIGQEWSRNSLDTAIPHPEKSIVWNKTRSEVVSLLGKPDSETRTAYRYNIGKPPSRSLGADTVEYAAPALGKDPEALSIYFDRESDDGRVIVITIGS